MSEPPAGAAGVTGRRRLTVVAVVGLVALLVVLLLPSSGIPSTFVQLTSGSLRAVGAPDAVSSPQLWERVLNVVLFVPVGVVLALLLPRWRFGAAVVLGGLGSLAMETVQWAVMPGRDGSWVDVLMNTLGTALGALAVAVWTRRVT